MLIGTWNLEGRWSARHEAFLVEPQCDLWLLTEFPHKADGRFGTAIRSDDMQATKSWAAIWGEGAVSAPRAHAAAACAHFDGTFICCAVLPWRGAGRYWPGAESGVAAMTEEALLQLRRPMIAQKGPVIWGGDWNHSLQGTERVGSASGRTAIMGLLDELELQVPTSAEPHREVGLSSIDHIGVPRKWQVTGTSRRVAADVGGRLSDHDAYVVDVLRP